MKIILLGGKANSGKDTSAEYMAEYYRSRGLDVVNIQIAYYIKMYAKEIAKWDGDNETKPRQLLQDLGTELIRKQIEIIIPLKFTLNKKKHKYVKIYLERTLEVFFHG